MYSWWGNWAGLQCSTYSTVDYSMDWSTRTFDFCPTPFGGRWLANGAFQLNSVAICHIPIQRERFLVTLTLNRVRYGKLTSSARSSSASYLENLRNNAINHRTRRFLRITRTLESPKWNSRNRKLQPEKEQKFGQYFENILRHIRTIYKPSYRTRDIDTVWRHLERKLRVWRGSFLHHNGCRKDL